MADLDEPSAAYVRHEAGSCMAAVGRLANAFRLLEAAFEYPFNVGLWPNAALTASRLSSLYLMTGWVDKAIDWARTGVDLAEKSREDPATAHFGFTPMENLTMLGYCLCQAGRRDEAQLAFEEAEWAQCEFDRANQQLISIKHFHYCDWFLSVGNADEVIRRTSYTLPLHDSRGWLADSALDHFLLGQAYFLQEQVAPGRGLSKSLDEINCAVDGLRRAGYSEFLVQGLLARARIFRVQGRLERMQRDLSESMALIQRSGFKLFEFKVQLEKAYIGILEGRKDLAGNHFQLAEAMVADGGFHRWDREIDGLRRAIE